MKKYLCLFVALLMLVSFAGCGAGDELPLRTLEPAPMFQPYAEAELEAQANKVLAEITMATGGVIKMELYPDIAPVTVENFVNLVNDGFYDGITFHRIIDGFMIQGGDPEGNGMGGSDKTIKGEFASNGVENNISHTRGIVSMARSDKPDSASSQFFIVHEDSTYLDKNYAAFGRVTEGMEVVDQIVSNAKVEDDNGTVLPENQPVIESIKIVK